MERVSGMKSYIYFTKIFGPKDHGIGNWQYAKQLKGPGSAPLPIVYCLLPIAYC